MEGLFNIFKKKPEQGDKSKKKEVRDNIIRTSPDGDKHITTNEFPSEGISEVCLILGLQEERPTKTIFSLRTKGNALHGRQIITLHAIDKIDGFKLTVLKIHYSESGTYKVMSEEVLQESPESLYQAKEELYDMSQLPQTIDFKVTRAIFLENNMNDVFDKPELIRS